MAFYDFQISKSKKVRKLMLNIQKYPYGKCVIGYIEYHMHEYSSEHNRLVLQIIGF